MYCIEETLYILAYLANEFQNVIIFVTTVIYDWAK